MAKKTKAEQARRKRKFQQESLEAKNATIKLNKEYQRQLQERESLIRRATIVDAIYNNRPELASVKNGILQLDMDNLHVKEDGILYWNKDDNPVLSGLDVLENYPLYDIHMFNGVLEFIGKHNQQKQATQTDIDLDDSDSEFSEEDSDEETDDEDADENGNLAGFVVDEDPEEEELEDEDTDEELLDSDEDS